MGYRTSLCRIAAALVIVGWSSPLVAGPPLAIDDPGVLAPGQWEIIVASTMASTPEGHAWEAPLLDVSYGLTPNTQASIAVPYVFVSPEDRRSGSDVGNWSIAYKWRFANTDKLQLAFAPTYTVGISVSAAARGVGDDSDILFLPLNFQYDMGEWSLNGELGYAHIKSGSDGWGYGGALSRPVGDNTVLMFEIYGGAGTDFDNDSLNFHVGLDTRLRQDLHLLLSAGSGLRAPAETSELEFDLFLGLQYFR